ALIPTAALLLVSVAAADQLLPNELGRVMILEYHKIDYPEVRWTRTPENFRRDLATLYAKGYRLIALGDLLDGRIVLPAGTTPIAGSGARSPTTGSAPLRSRMARTLRT